MRNPAEMLGDLTSEVKKTTLMKMLSSLVVAASVEIGEDEIRAYLRRIANDDGFWKRANDLIDAARTA